MRVYDLRLRRSAGEGIESERLAASDDGEALALAELRLRLTREFAEIVLFTAHGRRVGAFRRDSLNACQA